ncbi:hypothetical protein EP073_04030 [Geovibrio thiophilus]|uniref:citrate lyase holo-[acyl-carrier protein] synthase n=1 Tax=Geovibrio thiophilus TaxID=139438 RepID=A0A3R5Y658_9BACT|nr:citrate lyase holo-[acyl-carrier protein] synthase [Geovibrio thiophilus]QAR32603.1 hypothetical protein EP073_04030 [Geovibrio thiophilus]
MTRSEELRNKLLEARDARWSLITGLESGEGSLIVISSNMPGEDKAKADGLVSWAATELKKLISAETLQTAQDAAGRAVFMKTLLNPADAKKAGVCLEELHPFCRLLDIDVYSGTTAFGRKEAGLGRRKCLLCGASAADCIRTEKHTHAEAVSAAEKLLSGFHNKNF